MPGQRRSLRSGRPLAVVMMDLDGSDEAVTVAERVLSALRGLAVPPPQGDKTPHALTASFGVAACPPRAVDAEELVGRADAALYRAKASGVGCVVVWSSPKREPQPPRSSSEMPRV